MKRFIPLITDTLFFAIIFFVIPFIILSYFFSRSQTFIFSALFCLLFTTLFFVIAYKRTKKKIQKDCTDTKRNRVFNELDFSDRKKVYSIFENAFIKKGFKVENKRGQIYIESEKTLYYLAFGFDGLTKTDIVKCFNLLSGDEKGVILTSYLDKEVSAFAKRFGKKIEVKDRYFIYSLLEETNMLPEITFTILDDKKYRLHLSDFIDRKKALRFLLFGLMIFFMSFFVKFKVYYLVCGGIFLLLSTLCMLFGKKEER